MNGRTEGQTDVEVEIVKLVKSTKQLTAKKNIIPILIQRK